MTNLRLAVSDGVPVPDREVVRDFLSGITPIHIASISPEGGPAIGRYFGDDAEAAADYAISANDEGRNVYWTPNEPMPDCGSKPTKGQMQRVRFAYVDIDPPKDDRPFDKIAVAEGVIADNPTFVIDSGNGVQAFWRLGDPIDTTAENVAAIEGVNRRIATDFGGDPSAVNVDRLMRLPGTVNYPNVRKRERGRVPCMASVLLPDTGRGRPSLAQLVAYWPVPSADAPPVNAPVRPVERPSSATPAPVDAQTLDDLRDALQWLDADDRGAWVDCCLALKRLGNDGFRLWDEYSQRSPSYDPADASRVWASAQPTAIDYRFVFNEAAKHGWRNPGFRGIVDIAPDELPFNLAAFTDSAGRMFVPGVGVVQRRPYPSPIYCPPSPRATLQGGR